MKVLLITGGILFLLLSFILFVAAIVVFFVARSRRAKAGGIAQPGAQARPVPQPQPVAAPRPPVPQPPAPRPAAPPPPPPPPPPPAPTPPAEPVDGDGTIVIDRRQTFGALHGTAGALAGRILPIDTEGFFIGRDKSLSQVVIENPSVSKRHVWVGMRDGAVIAVDQQSTNGTYLNGGSSRISEVRLQPGDTLVISDDVATLEYRL